jgi:hypothetical protein
MMLCCAAATLGATVLAVHGRRTASSRRARLAVTLAATAVPAALAVLAAQHLGHYAARAEANDRSLLAEILAQPVCGGAAIAEGALAHASTVMQPME